MNEPILRRPMFPPPGKPIHKPQAKVVTPRKLQVSDLFVSNRQVESS